MNSARKDITDPDDGVPIRSGRGRRAAGIRRQLVIAGVGAVVVVVAVVVALVVASGKSRRVADDRPRDPLGVNPRANIEGAEWTHEQMVAYFNRRGLQLETKWFAIGVAMEMKRRNPLSTTPPGVIVWKHDTPQSAQIGAAENPGSFAWGRYHFDGGPGYMRQEIATLLGVPYP